MKKAGKIIGILILIAGIAYLSLGWAASCQNNKPITNISDGYDSIRVENTGAVYYSKDIADDGQVVTISGYYELKDRKYVYRDTAVRLDRENFGGITVKRH